MLPSGKPLTVIDPAGLHCHQHTFLGHVVLDPQHTGSEWAKSGGFPRPLSTASVISCSCSSANGIPLAQSQSTT